MAARKLRRQPAGPGSYEVILRTGGAKPLTVRVLDSILYPLALTWNRALGTDRERTEKAGAKWGQTGHEAILHLAKEGFIEKKEAEKFIVAAAKSGLVQVEFAWTDEAQGYAARIFPWEHVIALATKEARMADGHTRIVVIRVLRGGRTGQAAAGPAAYAACDPAPTQPTLNFAAEKSAIESALGANLADLNTCSLETLRADTAAKKPGILHFAATDGGSGPLLAPAPGAPPAAVKAEEVAKVTASHFPRLAVYSSCYSGRRLAPVAVACGAHVAIGFHGDVSDDSVPLFFGAFYRSWKLNANALEAVLAGLDAHNSQRKSADLGIVTLWSAKPFLHEGEMGPSFALPAREPSILPIPVGEWKKAAVISFDSEKALNYSVLHNSRGGLFVKFNLTKNREGTMPPLRIVVRLDTGVGDPSECRFVIELPAKANHFVELADSVVLPLGAPLLRQRGESLRATLSASVTCGAESLLEETRSILLLPCDEWRDDDAGRHLLPSFVFPRDPAVREIVTKAQPFLRSLADQPQAGFDGYQGGFSADAAGATTHQVRAMWAALQQVYRLDYVSPPPTYTNASQRLRTPEEILRANRGTCIELALLLASCLEHVGIYPVIFLTPGHAFAGYWTNEEIHTRFTKDPDYVLNLARVRRPKKGVAARENEDAAGPGQTKIAWLFSEPRWLMAIVNEIAAGNLIALEATGIALQRPFQDCVTEAAELLRRVLAETSLELQRPDRKPDDPLPFDGMLDIQTAREAKVMPLPIVSQGPAA